MKKIVCMKVALLLICAGLAFAALACGRGGSPAEEPAASPVAETVPGEETAPEPTAEPTPEPTAEPTPEPTASPAPEVTSLSDAVISRRDGFTFIAKDLLFAPEGLLRLTVAVENGTNKTAVPALASLTVNGWMMNGEKLAFDAAPIAPGETGEAVITVNGEDFSAMGIETAAELGCKFRLTEQDGGEELSVQTGTVANPAADAGYTDSFTRGETVLLDNKGLLVALQSCDPDMRTVTLYLEKKDKAAWASCCVAPICNGYTDYRNPFAVMEKGSRMLLTLDNGAIFDRNGVTSLASMDLYLTTQTATKIDNSILLTVENPAGTATVAEERKDESPVVFQDKYAILRYKGIDETIFPDKSVILIDLENITQTYIKTMEIIAYPAHATIQLDGTVYPLESDCTYSYPTTHGYLMLWPVGAPEGALQSASEAAVKLKLSRFRSGHLDPVTDTGWFTIPLKYAGKRWLDDQKALGLVKGRSP